MINSSLPQLSPSDFVAICNQTLELSMPIVIVNGEVSNFRISKNKWVYFDIKDEFASVKCFATIYALKMPIVDGMMVTITSKPQLHPLYNLSLTIIDIIPTGEGSIKQASDLLKDKLEKEGLFSLDRKRILPYPPNTVGLITSSESAAYGDFVKVLKSRWPLLKVILRDTKVQGDGSAEEVTSAIHYFNQQSEVEVLVIIRGGGSSDDLLTFHNETLVRAVAESRIPTLVAIGHERDISLAELAADVRASTPSNAAEIIAPTKDDLIELYKQKIIYIKNIADNHHEYSKNELVTLNDMLSHKLNKLINNEKIIINSYVNLLKALDPKEAMRKGYSIVKNEHGNIVSRGSSLKKDEIININFFDSEKQARVLG